MDSKRALLRLLALPGVTPALSYLTGTRATIFMLHRFSVPDLGVQGHDPEALRQNLAWLRKARFNLISVEDLFFRLREGHSLTRTAAFTIDDGYFDQAAIGAPIFEEFDCPVTCFVATGFLDREIWFWWDRLTYIFEKTKRRELRACIGARNVQYRWNSSATRWKAWWDLNLRCQDASESDRLACVEALSLEAEVELPASPPTRFAPMSWDLARILERRGVSFGPHSVTHPVLSTTSAKQAEWEITQSWARLSAEVRRPVRLFCYPNGRSQDSGDREILTIRRLGLWGALMAEPGELNRTDFLHSGSAAYRVPRFSYTDELPQVLQCLSGLENLKAQLRAAPLNTKRITTAEETPSVQAK